MKTQKTTTELASTVGTCRSVLVLYGLASALSLAYEVLWMKRLSLIFGVSLPAVGTTLSVYILGAVIGAYLISRYDRLVRSAPRTFSFLQVFIGIWTMALPWLLVAVESQYGLASITHPLGHHILRVLGAAIVLMPPAIAIGMVLPLLSRLGLPRVLAIGLLGSTVGALTSGSLILPYLGFTKAFLLLGMVNFLIAVLAYRLPFQGSRIQHRDSPSLTPDMRTIKQVLLGATLVGLALFIAETVWFKLIWLMFNQTAYTEGLVIAAVMLAMAVGAAFAIHWKPPIITVLIVTAVTQLALILYMEPLARFWTVAKSTVGTSFLTCLAAQLGFVLLALGPPSLGYGLALARLCDRVSPQRIGQIWAGHYLGCAAGALFASFFLIPILGVTVALTIASLILVLTIIIYGGRWSAALLGGLALVAGFRGDATYRQSAAGSDHKVVFHHEDSSGIIEVYERQNDSARLLLSNRLFQEGGSAPKQVWAEQKQGELSLALHPQRNDVLVVGLGTGITLGAMLKYTVGRITCVELSDGIIEASALFAAENNAILTEPRVSIVHQDGRNFVRLDEQHYDLVVQELFHPYRAGAAALYTTEHFQRCRDRLKAGGRMVQWIHTIQITPDNLRCLVKSFASVFPNVSLWMMNAQVMLLGGDLPPQPGPDNPAIPYFIAADETLRKWIKDAPLNHEDNLYLESSFYPHFQKLNTTALVIENLKNLLTIFESVRVLSDNLPNTLSTAARHRYEGIIARFNGNEELALTLYQEAFRLNPNNQQTREYLLQRYLQKQAWKDAVTVAPDHLIARYNWGVQLYKSDKIREAMEQFEVVISSEPNATDALFNLGNCKARLRRYQEAAQLYRRVLKQVPNHKNAKQNLNEIRRFLEQAVFGTSKDVRA